MDILNKSKFIKKNYQFISAIALLILILIVAIKPDSYISATYKGFIVWAKIVLPSLFAFFIFTKLLMQNKNSLKIFSVINKPFEKIYNVKSVGAYTFFMSVISGYPVGSKLTYEFFTQGMINKNEAHRLTAFCSTSGPMFILGSVAVSLFGNIRLGIIILCSHLLATLLNGLLYRNYNVKDGYNTLKSTSNLPSKESLNEIMYNTIISVLMVGGYIALCFTVMEIIFSLKITLPFSYLINCVLPEGSKVADCILKGIMEVTNGCVSLAESGCNLKTACIAISSLLSFGGFSIHLQSYMFLSKCGISYKYFLLVKVTQSILTILISSIFSAILL